MNDTKNKGGDERIPLWVAAINENPDILHSDYTPAVHKLSECGFEAAIAILPLLDSEDALERLRAQRVLEGVVQRAYGWKPGQGFPPESNGEKEIKNLMQEMGNYRADASKDERIAAIEKWEYWLQTKLEGDE